MALLTENLARQVAARVKARTHKTTSALLSEATQTSKMTFDIFLSHSLLDAEVVLGAKVVLEEAGYSVYVDWLDDPSLDRGKVSVKTAEQLRKRMKQSKALFYLHSTNATKSRWMPWELGFFDGFNGSVAIFPISQVDGKESYSGEEFLGLYPFVNVTGLTAAASGSIRVHRSVSDYMGLSRWIDGTDKMRPTS